jgi:hypothetical protein
MVSKAASQDRPAFGREQPLTTFAGTARSLRSRRIGRLASLAERSEAAAPASASEPPFPRAQRAAFVTLFSHRGKHQL